MPGETFPMALDHYLLGAYFLLGLISLVSGERAGLLPLWYAGLRVGALVFLPYRNHHQLPIFIIKTGIMQLPQSLFDSVTFIFLG